MAVHRNVRRAWADLVDLVLPRGCVVCGRPGETLCRGCVRGRPLLVDVPGVDVPVVAACRYEDAARTLLLSYKERGRRDLAGPVAHLLGTAVRGLGPPPGAYVLVPVPSAAAARRARGGDHVHALAVRAGPTVPALRLVRRVRDSAGLGVSDRRHNLDAAMRACCPHGSHAAVVVDDIVTTGATLGEAVRALRAAGWVVRGAAVVAATPRRRTRGAQGQGPGRLAAGAQQLPGICTVDTGSRGARAGLA